MIINIVIDRPVTDIYLFCTILTTLYSEDTNVINNLTHAY